MEEVMSETLEGRFTALSACFFKNILWIFQSCLFVCQELGIIPVLNVFEWWYRGLARLCHGCQVALAVECLTALSYFQYGKPVVVVGSQSSFKCEGGRSL